LVYLYSNKIKIGQQGMPRARGSPALLLGQRRQQFDGKNFVVVTMFLLGFFSV